MKGAKDLVALAERVLATRRHDEHAGADQPAAKPADKDPVTNR